MNRKHIALLLIGICGFLFIQIAMMARKERDKTALTANSLQAEEIAERTALTASATQLNTLQKSSETLITFLDQWEPLLEAVKTGDSAEVQFISKIRDGNLVTLSQRFETVQLKAGSALPTATRAQLTFEDNYARLMNWLGGLEENLPTVRVNSLKITQGTRPQDVRMELTVDQPIYRP